MNIKAVAAAAAVLVAAPALASAQTTAAPISVSSQAQEANLGASLYQQGEVRLTFVNQAAVPATEVDFNLTSHGQLLGTYSDHGTFSPGVQINRFFTTQEIAHDQQIAVATVKFADGTVWNSDDATPARRQADVSLR